MVSFNDMDRYSQTLIGNWTRRRKLQPRFSFAQVENCLNAAVYCWGLDRVALAYSLETQDLEDSGVVVYFAQPVNFQPSRPICLLYFTELGDVCTDIMTEGKTWYVAMCRPKEIFHQMFWKFRCGLVEAGLVPNTIYPNAEVLRRFKEVDAVYDGERLVTKLELATAFAMPILN